MKRRIINGFVIAPIICSMAMGSLTGCNKTNNNATQETLDTATKEIRLNDYRGSTIRTIAIRNKMMEKIDEMKQNNATIREENPNSFWSSDDYKDFVSNFLTIPIINDTMLLNEEETDWATVLTTIVGVSNSFTTLGDDGYQSKYSGLSITRQEKDEYSITGVTGYSVVTDEFGKTVLKGDLDYKILYDCDKDWAKAYAICDLSSDNVPSITAQLYEYRRLSDDAFVIQTSTERIYIEFAKPDGTEDNSTDTTDLRNREIDKFYYSRLTDGVRSCFEPYELKDETDDDGFYNSDAVNSNTAYETYYYINENGDFACNYGINDSIFYEEADINWQDWVFEETSLRQAFVYDDNVLSVVTYNKLNDTYDQFTYVSDGATDKVSDIISVDSLTGVMPLSELKSQILDSEDNETKETSAETEEEISVDENADEETTKSADADAETTTVSKGVTVTETDENGVESTREVMPLVPNDDETLESETKGDKDN